MKTPTQRPHRCNTDNPTRPCCWAARNAELDAMNTPEAKAKQQAAQAEHAAKLEREGGFITRGLD